MTVYAIAFQFDADEPSEREQRFADRVRSLSAGPCWDTRSGFSMILSDLPTDDLADVLASDVGFDPRKDSLLVMNLSPRLGSAFRGRLGQPELLQLLALRART